MARSTHGALTPELEDEQELLDKIETATSLGNELADLAVFIRHKRFLHYMGIALCVFGFFILFVLSIPRPIIADPDISEIISTIRRFLIPGYLILFFISYRTIISSLNVWREYYRVYRTRERLHVAIADAESVIAAQHKQRAQI